MDQPTLQIWISATLITRPFQDCLPQLWDTEHPVSVLIVIMDFLLCCHDIRTICICTDIATDNRSNQAVQLPLICLFLFQEAARAS